MVKGLSRKDVILSEAKDPCAAEENRGSSSA
jgi:hypothetical protein